MGAVQKQTTRHTGVHKECVAEHVVDATDAHLSHGKGEVIVDFFLVASMLSLLPSERVDGSDRGDSFLSSVVGFCKRGLHLLGVFGQPPVQKQAGNVSVAFLFGETAAPVCQF